MQRTIRASAAVVAGASAACFDSCSIATRPSFGGTGLKPTRPAVSTGASGRAGAGLLDVHPVQTQQVLAQDLALALLGQLRVAVAVAEVLRDLEVAERPQRPLRVP